MGGRRKREPRFPRPRATLPRRPAGPGRTEASARPGGGEAPARGGAGAGRGLWPPAGPDASVPMWQGRWPLPWKRGGAVVCAGGTRKRDPRFPRPRATVPCRPAGPGRTEASARPGGGEAPAGDGAGAGRGLWAPGSARGSVPLWQGRWPLPWKRWRCCRPIGRDQETRPAFPPPARNGPLQTGRSGKDRGQRPTRRARSARRGRGRALAGGFGPRLGKDQCADVAGAMAPAIQSGRALSPVRAGTGNAIRVSPARAERSPADRQVRERQRPAPDPAGGKRPTRRAGSARPGGREAPAEGGAGAGRGLWPPAGQGAACRSGRGDGPCHGSGGCCRPIGRDQETRPAFPPPARDGALQTGRSGRDRGQRLTRRGRSARRGRGGRWPGALAPGWAKISEALRQGQSPLPGCA